MGNILNIINSDEHFYNKNRNDYFMKCLTGSFYSSDLQDLFKVNSTNIGRVENKKYIYLVELIQENGLYLVLNNIPKKVKELVKKEKCIIIVGYESEGTLSIKSLNHWYKNNKVDYDLSKVYLLSGDLVSSGNETPVNIIKSTHVVDGISFALDKLKDNTMELDDNFDYSFVVKKVSDIDIDSKSKHFLTFMRNCARPHRIALASYYEYNNLWNNNISFLRAGLDTNQADFPEILDKKYFSSYKKVIDKKIVELDTKQITNKSNFNVMFSSEWKLYQETFLSVVSETIFDLDNIFISEKIIKPIYNLHPFIVTSSPLFLEKLKELGFKTFSPFIDESYDLEKNHKKRMTMIFDELDKFRSKSNQELRDWWIDILPILEHNQKTLLNFINTKTEKIKLLETLC